MRLEKRLSYFVLFILLALAVTLSSLHGQNRRSPLHEEGQRDSGVSLSQAESKQDEATPVQRGALSVKQKEHSKLHGQRYGGGRKLIDPAKPVSNAKVVIETPRPYVNPRAPVIAPFQYLQNIACEADAVVIGKVESKTSQLTEGEDFVFSDYGVRLEEVLKENRQVRVKPDSLIGVTRPGGAVEVNGKTISAVVATYGSLTVGRRYLLFLRRVPATGDYEAVSSKGTFLLLNGNASKLTEEVLPREIENSDSTSLIARVRDAITAGCVTSRKGANDGR